MTTPSFSLMSHLRKWYRSYLSGSHLGKEANAGRNRRTSRSTTGKAGRESEKPASQARAVGDRTKVEEVEEEEEDVEVDVEVEMVVEDVEDVEAKYAVSILKTTRTIKDKTR